MLQTLLASTALFSTVKAEVADRAQRYAFLAAMAVVALLFVLVGLGALAAAAAVALEPHLGLPLAIALVGGGAILIAAILVMIGSHRVSGGSARSRPSAETPDTPLSGIADAAGQAPVPWLLGALLLGIMLGRKG